jgi:hypothetical protein
VGASIMPLPEPAVFEPSLRAKKDTKRKKVAEPQSTPKKGRKGGAPKASKIIVAKPQAARKSRKPNKHAK